MKIYKKNKSDLLCGYSVVLREAPDVERRKTNWKIGNSRLPLWARASPSPGRRYRTPRGYKK